MENRPHDTEIWEHEQKIRADIAATSDFISQPIPTITLLDEYKDNNEAFQFKISDTAKQFPTFRRVRGDGNCFFRAFGFSVLEQLLFFGTQQQAQQFYEKSVKSIDALIQQGYPDYTIEDFHETYVEAISLATGYPKPLASFDYSSGMPVPNKEKETAPPPQQLPYPLSDHEKGLRRMALLAMFREESISDSLVYYTRLLTATHFKANAEFFQPFIDNGMTVHDFCSREVEPMARESDQVHITAISAALDTPIRVMYVDGSNSSNQASSIIFQEEGKASPIVNLLYRPGHYDILYASDF